MDRLGDVQRQLRHFANERDWGRFHTPKNLVMALAGEVGELSALLQWVEPEDFAAWVEDPQHAQALRHEVADVLAYLLQFADVVGVDPIHALLDKIEINARKYPAGSSRGNARKYTEL